MAGKRKTYALVAFWESKAAHDALRPADLTEEFLMPLRPMQYVVQREDGYYKRTDGTYVPPLDAGTKAVEDFEYVEGFSLEQQMTDLFRKYWRMARAKGFSGDHTGDSTKRLYKNGAVVAQQPTAPIVRDNSDPDRVLEFPEVVELRDGKRDFPLEIVA